MARNSRRRHTGGGGSGGGASGLLALGDLIWGGGGGEADPTITAKNAEIVDAASQGYPDVSEAAPATSADFSDANVENRLQVSRNPYVGQQLQNPYGKPNAWQNFRGIKTPYQTWNEQQGLGQLDLYTKLQAAGFENNLRTGLAKLENGFKLNQLKVEEQNAINLANIQHGLLVERENLRSQNTKDEATWTHNLAALPKDRMATPQVVDLYTKVQEQSNPDIAFYNDQASLRQAAGIAAVPSSDYTQSTKDELAKQGALNADALARAAANTHIAQQPSLTDELRLRHDYAVQLATLQNANEEKLKYLEHNLKNLPAGMLADEGVIGATKTVQSPYVPDLEFYRDTLAVNRGAGLAAIPSSAFTQSEMSEMGKQDAINQEKAAQTAMYWREARAPYTISHGTMAILPDTKASFGFTEEPQTIPVIDPTTGQPMVNKKTGTGIVQMNPNAGQVKWVGFTPEGTRIGFREKQPATPAAPTGSVLPVTTPTVPEVVAPTFNSALPRNLRTERFRTISDELAARTKFTPAPTNTVSIPTDAVTAPTQTVPAPDINRVWSGNATFSPTAADEEKKRQWDNMINAFLGIFGR